MNIADGKKNPHKTRAFLPRCRRRTASKTLKFYLHLLISVHKP